METKNNDILLAITVTVLFIILFGLLMIMVIANFIRRKRKILIEKQEQELSFHQQLLQSQIEIQDHTLKKISQEIHDNVGQVLSLAKLNLNILSFQNTENTMLLTIKDLVSKAIVDLRDLTASYYADKLVENGLLATIQHEINQLKKTGIYTISFQSSITNEVIDKNKTIFVYRMVQEILNNIIKHSEAKNIGITIFDENEWIHIYIDDDGKGFDINSVSTNNGMGLQSIQQRAKKINAKIIIDTATGKGTRIKLIFKN